MITFATAKSSPLEFPRIQFIVRWSKKNTICSDFYRQDFEEDVGILAHSKLVETVCRCFLIHTLTFHGKTICKPNLP